MLRKHVLALVTTVVILMPLGTTVPGLDPEVPEEGPGSDVVSVGFCGPGGSETPLLVDECGDAMTGDLGFEPTRGIAFAGGRLTGSSGLMFGSNAVCLANSGVSGCNGGDITAVNAGTGLLGGAQSGAANLDVDFGSVQARVAGTCVAGSSVRAISTSGTVTCEADDDTLFQAGSGLSLTGTTFSVNPATIQSRVNGVCAAGFAIRSIAGDGTVACEQDDDTTYTAGTGLTLSGTQFNADTSVLQRRVTGTCAVGQAIRTIDAAGAVTCEADDDTAYSAGDGLNLAGTQFALIACSTGQVLKRNSTAWACGSDVDTDTTYTAGDGLGLAGTQFALMSCSNGQILKRGASAWACGSDADTTYSAGSGLGLTGTTFGVATGGVTSAMVADGAIVAADVDSSSIQRRVASTCAAGSSIRAIATDGSVTCETDDDTNSGGDITGVSVGSGLSGGGTAGDLTVALITCASGEVLKAGTGGTWACASDANGGGTVTSVASGAGLTGGPITSTGTLSIATGGVTSAMVADGSIVAADVDSNSIQRRVTGACSAGSSIRSVAGDGTVVCEADDDTTYSSGSGLSLTGTTFAVMTCADGQILKRSGGAWACAADDSTAYAAGFGLTLGGTTFAVNATQVQQRVTGSCAAGLYVRVIAQDGTVTCGTDADSGGTVTSVASGAGLTGGPITGSGTLSIASGGVTSDMIADGTIVAADVDATSVQRRVTGTCAGSSMVTAVAQDGTVTCGSLSAGQGLNLVGSTVLIANGGVTSAMLLDSTIATVDLGALAVTSAKLADGAVTSIKIVDGTIVAADVADGTLVAAKLADGAVTSAKVLDGTIVAADVDATSVQRRVTGSCGVNSTIRAIAQDGTVTCDDDPTPAMASVSGLVSNPNGTLKFIALTLAITLDAGESALVTSHAGLGGLSTNMVDPANLRLFICYRTSGSTGAPTTVGGGIVGLSATKGQRAIYGLSATLSPAAGNYDVGLCGNTSNGNTDWNNNDWSYTSALVV